MSRGIFFEKFVFWLISSQSLASEVKMDAILRGHLSYVYDVYDV